MKKEVANKNVAGNKKEKKQPSSKSSTSALLAASKGRNATDVRHNSRQDISGSRNNTVNTGPIVNYEDEK